MSEPTTRAAFRVNIAYTEVAEAAARRLVERFRFPQLVDAARTGVAYALRSGYALDRPSGFGSTSGSNFNVGTVDPRGELRELLLALHPEITDDPYRVIETLMSLGTVALDEQVTAGEVLSLKDMVSPPAE